MQEALVAKLQPGVKDSPINDGLVQAINLVEAFLNSYRESPAELEALKAQVKRVMMSQVGWVGEGGGWEKGPQPGPNPPALPATVLADPACTPLSRDTVTLQGQYEHPH